MKPLATLLSAVALSMACAASASAAPTPSPVAPAHAGAACEAVLAHNPQASPESHSAVPAQMNFAEVGAAFCGV